MNRKTYLACTVIALALLSACDTKKEASKQQVAPEKRIILECNVDMRKIVDIKLGTKEDQVIQFIKTYRIDLNHYTVELWWPKTSSYSTLCKGKLCFKFDNNFLFLNVSSEIKDKITHHDFKINRSTGDIQGYSFARWQFKNSEFLAVQQRFAGPCKAVPAPAPMSNKF